MAMMGSVAACDDSHDDSHDASHDDSGNDAGGEESSSCSPELEADTYRAGLTKMGQHVSLTFISADPAPPDLGQNVLKVQVVDNAGEPQAATSLALNLWMPEHGHGASTQPVVTATDGEGAFEVSAVNLHMAGLWELRFTVETATQTDDITFAFCVQSK